MAAAAKWSGLLSENLPETPFEIKTPRFEAAPLCPWREPERDLSDFFPGAVRYEAETHILSGWRMELAQRLGRMPTAGENALHLYRIFGPQQPMGAILTTRVKGEYGAIEIVLAASNQGEVIGLRLQRLREPEGIRTALQQPAWLDSFRGKTTRHPWQFGRDIPEPTSSAHTSADAVVEGVRGLLILLDTAAQAQPAAARHVHK